MFPTKDGEYLFYFGGAKKPYYAVDTFRLIEFDDDSDCEDAYLKNNRILDVTAWWHLPKPHEFVR
jgi:hypothetical protein